MALKLRKSGEKGKRPRLLIQSLLRSESVTKTKKTPVATNDAQDDPYEFIDSQSFEPDSSPKTPKSFIRRGAKTTPHTDKSHRKSPSSLTRKSPAEMKEERLLKKEQEDLKKALEESRKEAAKEERRRRWQRRKEEEEEEREEEEEDRVENGTQSSDGASEEAVIRDTTVTCPKTNDHSATAENNNDWSQSTPPLSGVPHSSQSTPILRTPRVYVTKLPTSLTPSRHNSRDTTPILAETVRVVEEEEEEVDKGGEKEVVSNEGDSMEEKEEERGAMIKEETEEEGITPVNQSLRNWENNEKKSLSLKRGKKRVLTISQTTPPYLKKQRIDLNSETVNGHISPPSPPPPPPPPSAANPPPTSTKSLPKPPPIRQTTPIKAERKRPPEMFAPNSSSLSSYTATILNAFNSYLYQLRETQSNVVFHVPWGKPVPSHSRQSQSSLSWPHHVRRGVRPGSLKPPPHRHLPAIDLATGDIVCHSPSNSGSANRRCSRRKERILSFLKDTDEEEEDEDGTPSTSTTVSRPSGTPVRPHLPLKSRDSEKKRKCFVPPGDVPQQITPPHSNQSTSVPALSTTPDPPHPPPSAGFDISTTISTYDDGITLLPPNDIATITSSASTTGDCDRERHTNDPPSTPSCLGEEEREREDVDGIVVGGSGAQYGKGRIKGSLTESGRRRKRARILDDSDSEIECDSKYSSSDVIPAKNNTSSAAVKSSAAAMRTERRRRRTPTKTRHNGSSFIDLTEGEEMEEKKEGEVEEEEVERMVSCPLCSEQLPVSVIEAHAAECGQEAEEEEKPRKKARPASSLRQSSLLAPRFRQPQIISPSSSPPSPTVIPQYQEVTCNSVPGDGERDDEVEEEEEEEDDGVVCSGGSVSGGPVVKECEGGGYQVDPSSISSSPIKSFRRITELDPKERDTYYNQFPGRKVRGHLGQNSSRRGHGKEGRGRGRRFLKGRFRGRGGRGGWRGNKRR